MITTQSDELAQILKVAALLPWGSYVVVMVTQYMLAFFVGGATFFCQKWLYKVTASMDTDICFVDVICEKLLAPELYLQTECNISVKKFFTANIFRPLIYRCHIFICKYKLGCHLVYRMPPGE